MSRRLNDKVAIVTGATSGIGRATALLFAAEGAKVVATGRRAEQGASLVEEIRKAGGEATFVQADATKADDLARLVDTAVKTYGRIDILINNAGVLKTFNFLEMDEARDFDPVFETNVRSYFRLTRLVLPHMLAARKGAIVNIASIASEIAVPFHASYCASKGAIKQFTKAIALEYATSGIRVNAVLPGLTTSDMVPEGSDFEKMVISTVPMGRAAKAMEIATGILFLASDEASFCTGTTLVMDGGATSQ
jgi:NAD(P)-dependent dehydrogenase (short-subunit alcohol dehydrogenase family)